MKLTLFVLSGPHAGEPIPVDPGGSFRVGTNSQFTDRSFSDPEMSAVHFVLEHDAAGWNVRDLNSRNGTLVNGLPVPVATLTDNDQITAGTTVFLVRMGVLNEKQQQAAASTTASSGGAGGGGAGPAGAVGADRTEEEKEAEETKLPPGLERLEKALCDQPLTVFALLDQAKDEAIQPLLSDHRADAYPLLDVDRAPHLAPVTPMLVALEKKSKLFKIILKKGWGKSWGIFFSASVAPFELRSHFRRLLMARDEEGKEFYFRFYDPRVLRQYLPTCTSSEADAFFGPAQWFVLEDDDPAKGLAYFSTAQGAVKKELKLEGEEPVEIGWRSR